MKNLKKIPRFKNEDAERKFWAKADTSKYFDWNSGQRVLFPNLKPTTELISLRVPKYLLARIRELANSRDVPYQSLIKVFLAERVKREFGSAHFRPSH